MKRFYYRWYHIPSGKTGISSGLYETTTEFWKAICDWNKGQPERWIYAPIEEPNEQL
jgi:hypothetical protein